MHKFIEFIHETGTIMYVGGILSHIVMGQNAVTRMRRPRSTSTSTRKSAPIS